MSRRQRVTPEVQYLDDGAAVFRVPFDADWVAGVKALPAHAREWDPHDKVWIIEPPYVAEIVALSRWAFGYIAGAHSPHPPRQAASADPFAALHILPSAPPELIDGAYRILAKLHHPDRGGSHEQMLALTAAHDTLRRRSA